MIEAFVEPRTGLDYFGGTSATYAGFDRFDRVIDQKWYDYRLSQVRDRYTYGYDRASNRLYRENTVSSAKDELYAYDGMDQLVNFDRGDLNEQKTDLTGTRVREEDFQLDPTGNWTDYVQKNSGTTVLDQDREHNHVNEIDVDDDHSNAAGASITASTGTNWYDPTYDAAGNMTSVPKPSSLANGLTLTYLCSCQLAGAGFLGTVGRRSSRGTGRCSFSHSSIAA